MRCRVAREHGMHGEWPWRRRRWHCAAVAAACGPHPAALAASASSRGAEHQSIRASEHQRSREAEKQRSREAEAQSSLAGVVASGGRHLAYCSTR